MNQFEFRELDGGEDFDPKDLSEEASFTQAKLYSDWQKSLGRTVRRFIVKSGVDILGYFQLVKYPLSLGKSYLYCPYGPITKEFSLEFLEELYNELYRIAREEGSVFVRLDFTPRVKAADLAQFFFKARFYTYHSAYFQPRAEWFLDVVATDDEQLALMDKKTRYSLRMAEKKDVETEIVTSEFGKHFENFYRLMQETAKRNGFSLHPKKYYKAVFDSLSSENAYLSLARYKDKLLVSDLVIVYNGVANHVFGGSSSEERDRQPTYLAQWAAIRHAHKLGLKQYNFGGISTKDNEEKSWDGITLFKRRFGGGVVTHSDFYDLVVSGFWYKLYNLRKRLKKVK